MKMIEQEVEPKKTHKRERKGRQKEKTTRNSATLKILMRGDNNELEREKPKTGGGGC